MEQSLAVVSLATLSSTLFSSSKHGRYNRLRHTLCGGQWKQSSSSVFPKGLAMAPSLMALAGLFPGWLDQGEITESARSLLNQLLVVHVLLYLK
jgi:hypothetical protein